MQTITNSETVRVAPRSTTQDKAQDREPARKPNSSGLSREDLKKLVAEMIG